MGRPLEPQAPQNVTASRAVNTTYQAGDDMMEVKIAMTFAVTAANPTVIASLLVGNVSPPTEAWDHEGLQAPPGLVGTHTEERTVTALVPRNWRYQLAKNGGGTLTIDRWGEIRF